MTKVGFAYKADIIVDKVQSVSLPKDGWLAPTGILLVLSGFLSGYGYRPHASGEFDSESGKKINPLSRVEKNKSATNPITCGRVNPDIFESDDVKRVSSLSPNNKPIWRNNVSGEPGRKMAGR